MRARHVGAHVRAAACSRASRRAPCARLTKICQSSCASPGRRQRARRGLQAALLVHVGAESFSNDARAGQHDVGGAREIGQQHALHDEERQLARLARVDHPRRRRRSSRPGPGSKTKSALTRAALHLPPERREVRLAVRGRLDGEAEVLRAPDVRRVDRRDLELRVRRLRFDAGAPADRHAVLGQPERAAEPAEQEQLLDRGVRRDQEPQLPRAARRRSTRSAIFASASRMLDRLQLAAARCAPAPAAGGRPLRSSGSRSGRCRTSSSRSPRGCSAASCARAARPSPTPAWP